MPVCVIIKFSKYLDGRVALARVKGLNVVVNR